MVTKGQQQVYSEVVLYSRTGASLFKDVSRLTAHNLHMYKAGADSPPALKEQLEAVGFTVIATSDFGVSILGDRMLYTDFFKVNVVERPVQMLFGGSLQHEANAFFMEETPSLPSDIAPLAESVYIPRRGWFLAGEGPMPATSYYALRPPDDIVTLTNAAPAHNRGFRGGGVKVAMVDSGFIQNHDYYAGRGYNITVHAAIGDVNQDEYGHGTGIASNLLAIAPECDFHFFKMSEVLPDGQEQWATLAAFRMAVQAGAQVITNSWGQFFDPVLEAEIVAAVAAGVTVIFACGNGGYVGWPGCMSEIISVGGAYPRQDGTWEASSYASSGISPRCPGRHCPDLSAIVGQAPRGIFIVQPTVVGSILDQGYGNSVFPNGDQTGTNDGWLVASGTGSTAAPMVAGASALLLEAKPSLTPAEIKQTLADTCIDVVQGASASNETAGIGPDSATGAGMIDIGAAVDEVAKPLPCPTAPFVCARAPVCRIAPVECVRAPLECARAPVTPIPCPRAPFTCRIAPIIPVCRPAPIDGCLRGPWKRPIDPRERIREREPGRLVPVVVMVAEEELEMWLAQEQAYAMLEEMGTAGEYADFPDVESCQRGPFDPRIEE